MVLLIQNHAKKWWGSVDKSSLAWPGHFTARSREFLISLLGLAGESSNWSRCDCDGQEKDPYSGRKHTRHIWHFLYWLKYLCVRKDMRTKLCKLTSCPWWVSCSWQCDQFWHVSPVIQSWIIKWYHSLLLLLLLTYDTGRGWHIIFH
jgi:hypothetical protein